jgi:hypothetical protein
MKNYTGSDLGQDFKEFYRLETNRIKKHLKSIGCTDIQFSRQFYYFYGFFTSKSGQIWYVNSSDIRHFGYNKLMYRTASSYKDFTGGMNQYVSTNRGELINMKIY